MWDLEGAYGTPQSPPAALSTAQLHTRNAELKSELGKIEKSFKSELEAEKAARTELEAKLLQAEARIVALLAELKEARGGGA